MTDEQYHATLSECLSLVWEAQLALEKSFDALSKCHVAIRAATSTDRINRALASHKKRD
jgi:hypothetical protein